MTNPPITKRDKQTRSHNFATLVGLLSFVVVAFFVGNAWARIRGTA
ncbi:hypothetical protein Q9K02_08615 [Qipengyuania sp. G39]|uniref:Cytochrome C oxidase assembly protein n=1 Tax=Qipengyuania profundimaris TaxID=3067652 RepID=A0ABT9HPY3_9SPHN|nr:hypothetical protein [Qipengyuania sp. G39]MDP4575194.1 hypothetical protein [Qipengyuania sp. G39]